MKSIEDLRKAARQIGALAAGVSIDDEIWYRGGLISSRQGNPEIKLGVDKPPFFQCLDAASPNYGKRIFIAGFDPVGSTEFLVGEDCG